MWKWNKDRSVFFMGVVAMQNNEKHADRKIDKSR